MKPRRTPYSKPRPPVQEPAPDIDHILKPMKWVKSSDHWFCYHPDKPEGVYIAYPEGPPDDQLFEVRYICGGKEETLERGRDMLAARHIAHRHYQRSTQSRPTLDWQPSPIAGCYEARIDFSRGYTIMSIDAFSFVPMYNSEEIGPPGTFRQCQLTCDAHLRSRPV